MFGRYDFDGRGARHEMAQIKRISQDSKTSDETKSIQLARTRRVIGRREEKGRITHILLLQNGHEELQRRTDVTELHILAGALDSTLVDVHWRYR